MKHYPSLPAVNEALSVTRKQFGMRNIVCMPSQEDRERASRFNVAYALQEAIVERTEAGLRNNL